MQHDRDGQKHDFEHGVLGGEVSHLFLTVILAMFAGLNYQL